MITKIFQKSFLKRLDNIIQWQEMDVFKSESVSQHSFKVTIFCRVLLEDIFGFCNNNLDVLNFKIACIDNAMFHDWDEALILRDISHETKYNDYNGEEIRRVLDNLSKFKAIDEFSEIDSDSGVNWTASSNMIIGNICGTSGHVKTFVKLCDWLALAFYINRERSLGNRGLDLQWDKVKKGLEKSIESVKGSLEIKFNGCELNFSELNNLIEEIYGKER